MYKEKYENTYGRINQSLQTRLFKFSINDLINTKKLVNCSKSYKI